MFSSEESLKRRTGPHGTGRLKYLQAIVTEYQDTSDKGEYNTCVLWTYKSILSVNIELQDLF